MAIVRSWYPASPGVPTAEERLQLVLRLCDADRVREVAIFRNGTAILLLSMCKQTPEEVIKVFDIPGGGAGGAGGDIDTLPFDDGTVVFQWVHPYGFDGPPTWVALSLVTKEEMERLSGRPPAEHSKPDLQALGAGLALRHARSIDATERTVVASWKRAE
jgi:hypothetical protein